MPGGVPLPGVAYFAATLVAMVILNKTLGPLVGLLPAPIRYVIVPLAVAVAATHARPDGRSALSFARSWLEARYRRGRRSACRRVPDERETVSWKGKLRVRWDVDSPRLRRCRVHGPSVVEFLEPVDVANDRHTNLVARRGRGRPQTARLKDGRSVKVR